MKENGVDESKLGTLQDLFSPSASKQRSGKWSSVKEELEAVAERWGKGERFDPPSVEEVESVCSYLMECEVKHFGFKSALRAAMKENGVDESKLGTLQNLFSPSSSKTRDSGKWSVVKSELEGVIERWGKGEQFDPPSVEEAKLVCSYLMECEVKHLGFKSALRAAMKENGVDESKFGTLKDLFSPYASKVRSGKWSAVKEELEGVMKRWGKEVPEDSKEKPEPVPVEEVEVPVVNEPEPVPTPVVKKPEPVVVPVEVPEPVVEEVPVVEEPGPVGVSASRRSERLSLLELFRLHGAGGKWPVELYEWVLPLSPNLAAAEETVEVLLELIGDRRVPEKPRVIDVGTGPGTFMSAYKQKLGSPEVLVGVDISEEMVERASEKGEAVVGSALELPYGDGEFDVVNSTFLLDQFKSSDGKDLETAFFELSRVAKRGGVIVFTAPKSFGLTDEMKQGLREMGLSVMEQSGLRKRRMAENIPEEVVSAWDKDFASDLGERAGEKIAKQMIKGKTHYFNLLVAVKEESTRHADPAYFAVEKKQAPKRKREKAPEGVEFKVGATDEAVKAQDIALRILQRGSFDPRTVSDKVQQRKKGVTRKPKLKKVEKVTEEVGVPEEPEVVEALVEAVEEAEEEKEPGVTARDVDVALNEFKDKFEMKKKLVESQISEVPVVVLKTSPESIVRGTAAKLYNDYRKRVHSIRILKRRGEFGLALAEIKEAEKEFSNRFDYISQLVLDYEKNREESEKMLGEPKEPEVAKPTKREARVTPEKRVERKKPEPEKAVVEKEEESEESVLKRVLEWFKHLGKSAEA